MSRPRHTCEEAATIDYTGIARHTNRDTPKRRLSYIDEKQQLELIRRVLRSLTLLRLLGFAQGSLGRILRRGGGGVQQYKEEGRHLDCLDKIQCGSLLLHLVSTLNSGLAGEAISVTPSSFDDCLCSVIV